PPTNCNPPHRDLPPHRHSVPTRRSSDLQSQFADQIRDAFVVGAGYSELMTERKCTSLISRHFIH
ncbi:hypothetical protein PJP09_29160, partial [Mycobacterium kansasii]